MAIQHNLPKATTPPPAASGGAAGGVQRPGHASRQATTQGQGSQLAPSGFSQPVDATAFSLTDAAEELSLHMAHKVEEKHHSERKFAPERARRVVHADEVVDAMQQSHEPDAHAKLVELTKHLLAGHEGPRKLVTQSYRDVTQQFLALQYALRQGERERAPDSTLERLRTAIADLESDHGPSIRAGLNALPAAADFAGTAEGVGTFLDTYRDIVLGEPSLSQTLATSLERFGGDNIEKAIRQLTSALGADLAAVEPSTQISRLSALVSDLYKLEVMITALEDCAEIASTMNSRGYTAVVRDPLLTDIVAITDSRWVDAHTIEGLAAKRAVDRLPDQIDFLKSVRAIFRQFPVHSYPDKETRNAVLDANQAALDIIIAKEDEE